jgi:flagellar hook-length control protein FliK
MNATQVDHLLQVTAIRPEPLGGSHRTRDLSPPFDDHFRTAQDRSAALKPSSPPEPQKSSPAEKQSSAATPDDPPPDAAESQVSALEPKQQVASNDQSPAESASREGDSHDPQIAAAGASSDESDSEHDKNAEVAALLAKEQTVQVATAETAAEEGELPTKSAESDQSPTETDPTAATKATAEAAATATDAVPVAQVEQESTVEAGAEQRQDVRQADGIQKQQASQEAVADLETTVEPSGDEQRESSTAKETPGAAARGKLADNHSASEHAADQPQEKTATASATATRQVASTAESQAVSTKSEKKSSARSAAPAGDAQASPVGRPATVAQVPETTTTAPVAANAQQQLSAKVTGDAASAAKSMAGPKEAKPGMLSSLAQLDRGAAGGTRGGNRAGQTESTPVVDPARFVSRVARAVQTAHERGGPLQLRLSPPELGALRLELSVDRGALTAKIETENSNARQVLLDNLPALRDRLADQNIKVERFDVDVRRDPSGDSPNYAPQDRDEQQRQQATGNSRTAPSRRAPAPLVDEPAPVRRTISTTSINVVA